MGYSCTAAAGAIYDAWQDGCYKSNGSSNVYEFAGNKYFFERGKEQSDGSITGTIFKYVSETHVVKSGTFKIGADGTILRAHSILKEFARKYKKNPPQRVFFY